MASITPRMSGLWMDGYFDTDDPDAMGEDGERAADDGRTPLDRTIDRIGMGSYQWTLLTLCGFGWLADNMWIQTVAIVLPRVQQHYAVPDNYIGYLSSSMFAGMMLGAVGWGSCSDLLGRSTAFNLTLFFTSVFGLAASFVPSFSILCVVLFFLGTSVGGSMPTDGTLLLEHMPRGKQYLVTALSVFFSVGSVLSAVAGILVIPKHSCPRPSTADPEPACDVESQNNGWKYLFLAVGLITLSFFLARIVFFRLHESPRYLVHAGRPEEALLSLKKISRFNGSELSLNLHDVDDRPRSDIISREDPAEEDEERAPFISKGFLGNVNAKLTHADKRVIFDADTYEEPEVASERVPIALAVQDQRTLASPSPERIQYDSTGSSDMPLDGHTFITPTSEVPPTRLAESSPNEATSAPSGVSFEGRARATSLRRDSTLSRRSSFHEAKARVCWALPMWLRRPLWAWLDRLALVLSPEWLRTTLLVWAMWGFMSLAYTMVNVFLPKMLEMRSGSSGSEQQSLDRTMWDIVIFTTGGCPGAILGAYMVESSLGRRLSLAGSTFVTALFCLAFVFAQSSLAIRFTTIGISLSATTMWAVLYGWTPQIFTTSVRGTACGTASALSRIGGMIAPVLGGLLLVADQSLPVYTSVVIFALAGVCTLMLRVEEKRRPM